ncbi:MAG TPA: PfkB family carbohydrate kinase [Pyrinomonadaceae bacterium]|nr:PfkB family carbohydrate kinase [Pyrinomonadaceae bacterium]
MRYASSSVVVVGSIFLDYKCFRNESPGIAVDKTRVSHGGVARNIAENLGWLGVNVELIALSEATVTADLIAKRLRRAGVKLKVRNVAGGIGNFIATLDESGALVASTAVLPPFELLSWNFLNQHRNSLAHAKYIVVETGLPVDLLKRVFAEASRNNVPVCGVPTRLDQISLREQRAELIGLLDCLVLNNREAAMMLDEPVDNDADAFHAAEQLQREGARAVVITLGARGVVAVNGKTAPRLHPAPPARVLDTTGAGDAFVAGLIGGLAVGRSFADGISCGLTMAHRTVETLDTVKDEPSHILGGETQVRAIRSSQSSTEQKRQYA